MLIAQWRQSPSEQHPEDNVHGADLYVDNELIGIDDDNTGSTLSTVIVSAAAEALFTQGLTMEQVIAKIKSVSTVMEYEIDEVIEQALVFDPKSLLPLTTP